MSNKADVLLHPVRIKIIRALMVNDGSGLTPLEIAKVIKDVPQATLYRHINVLSEYGIIRIVKEKKVRSVSEKYYVLNTEETHLTNDEWQSISSAEKINHYMSYQLSLLNQYQDYLTQLEEKENPNDSSSFSILELKLDDDTFKCFQTELTDLMMKYYNQSSNNTAQESKTIGVTIIPDA